MKWLASLSFVALLAAADSQPEISDLVVTRQGNELLLSFALENAWTDEMAERIESGLPTGFTYHVKLERLRRWWFDKTVSRSTLEVVAMYNAITREYLVNTKQDGRLIDSRVIKSKDKLLVALTSFHALPLLEIEDVPGRLVARVRVALGSRTILGIIPTTVHTAWTDSERFRAHGLSLRTEPDEVVGNP